MVAAINGARVLHLSLFVVTIRVSAPYSTEWVHDMCVCVCAWVCHKVRVMYVHGARTVNVYGRRVVYVLCT